LNGEIQKENHFKKRSKKKKMNENQTWYKNKIKQNDDDRNWKTNSIKKMIKKQIEIKRMRTKFDIKIKY
jgi:hypothetical protein